MPMLLPLPPMLWFFVAAAFVAYSSMAATKRVQGVQRYGNDVDVAAYGSDAGSVAAVAVTDAAALDSPYWPHVHNSIPVNSPGAADADVAVRSVAIGAVAAEVGVVCYDAAFDCDD